MYDATTKIESIKIPNLIPARSSDLPGALPALLHNEGEYQLFVNRREEICVMQSSADVECGRYIKVSLSLLIQQSKFNSAQRQKSVNRWDFFCACGNKYVQPQLLKFHSWLLLMKNGQSCHLLDKKPILYSPSEQKGYVPEQIGPMNQALV